MAGLPRPPVAVWAGRLNALHPDKYPAKGLAPMGEDHPLAQGLSADEVEWHEPEQAGGPPRDNDGWEELLTWRASRAASCG